MLMKVRRPPVRISPHISGICLSTFCWSSNSPCDETTIILCVGVTNASHNCCYCNSAQWAPSETRTFELFCACQGCWLIKHRRGGEADKQTYPKVMKNMKKHYFLVQEVDKGDAKTPKLWRCSSRQTLAGTQQHLEEGWRLSFMWAPRKQMKVSQILGKKPETYDNSSLFCANLSS